MAREIKFRAWDKILNKFVECGGEAVMMVRGTFSKHSEIELSQSTGLLDKNGKEIYEGDIVKTIRSYADDYGNKVDPEETIFEVKWKEHKGMQYAGFSLYPSDDIYNLEIIGNIYENKELLKV